MTASSVHFPQASQIQKGSGLSLRKNDRKKCTLKRALKNDDHSDKRKDVEAT